MAVPRAIRKVFTAVEKAEGMGAKVRRSIGTAQLRNFSPFLMLDHAKVEPPAAFPDHPHRGQETISYILSGALDHEDFQGGAGTLEAGDLQFMTAGRGIMHAELPRAGDDGSPSEGLQLWVDLPKHLKMTEPRYRDLRAKEIPQAQLDNGRINVKVISGESGGVESVRDLAYTPVWYLDIEAKPGAMLVQPVPKGWNAFAYMLGGKATFGSGASQKSAEKYQLVVFERDGDEIQAFVPDNADENAHFVLLAGQVLDQEIVQYGPFVLNSQEEVYQALEDFQTFSNGFERAKGWESNIGRMIRQRG